MVRQTIKALSNRPMSTKEILRVESMVPGTTKRGPNRNPPAADRRRILEGILIANAALYRQRVAVHLRLCSEIDSCTCSASAPNVSRGCRGSRRGILYPPAPIWSVIREKKGRSVGFEAGLKLCAQEFAWSKDSLHSIAEQSKYIWWSVRNRHRGER
jgi:hypothetical protein